MSPPAAASAGTAPPFNYAHGVAELAPVDPRGAWDLPAPGALAPISDPDELTSRVLAPNPSPLTLDGTNTYVLGQPGHGAAVVIDPGPRERAHLGAVRGVLERRDAACELILLTHHHPDHAAAARPWARRLGCRVAAPTGALAGPGGLVVADGDRIDAAGITLEVVATPGHTADHVSYRLPTGALVCGDHVLGRGTAFVAHPDGDLAAYLESLRRVLALGPDALYPGHGPVLERDPAAVVRYYLAHREWRQRQILAVLSGGAATPRELVVRLYADVDRRLWPAAERSTRATLDLLAAEGRVVLRAGRAELAT